MSVYHFSDTSEQGCGQCSYVSMVDEGGRIRFSIKVNSISRLINLEELKNAEKEVIKFVLQRNFKEESLQTLVVEIKKLSTEDHELMNDVTSLALLSPIKLLTIKSRVVTP